jgi:hypothetical protein
MIFFRKPNLGALVPLVMTLIGVVLLLSCIERSNPFDPLNLAPARREEIQKDLKPSLDTILTEELAVGQILGTFSKLFSQDSITDLGTLNANTASRGRNIGQMSANVTVEALNLKQILLDSLQIKGDLELLNPLILYGPYPDFATTWSQLLLAGARLSGVMATANSRNAPLEVYPSAYRDSILRPFVKDSTAFARFQGRMDSANLAVLDSNKNIFAYNAIQDSLNQSFRAYNALIQFRQTTRDRPLITKSDSLQATTFIAKAGDSLFLGPGIFNVDLRFTKSGTVDSPIVVRGYPGMATILKADTIKGSTSLKGSAMILSNRAYIQFEGIVFRKGGISGVKLEANCRKITFKQCQFDSSKLWGLEAVDSEVEMLDCLVRANGGGVRTTAAPNTDLRISLVNNLVVQNGGHGLEAVSPLGEVIRCTFSDNSGEGIRVNSPLRLFSITNTIVSGNKGIGVYREPTTINQTGFLVKDSDVWGNVHADWDFTGIDSVKAQSIIKANFNVNPRFIDTASYNYSPAPGSKLDNFQTQQPLSVIIGYRP